MSKIQNGGLDQYGSEPFERQQSGTAGVEGVKRFTKQALSSTVTSESFPAAWPVPIPADAD